MRSCKPLICVVVFWGVIIFLISALIIPKTDLWVVLLLDFLWFVIIILIFMLLEHQYGFGKNSSVNELIEKFDLYVGSNPGYLSNIPHEKRNKLIENTKKALQNVKNHGNLEPDVYYMLLYALFFTATGNVWSASIMDDNEWVVTPEEDEYLKVNLDAVKRKIHLKRIFIVSEDEVNKKLNIAPINTFIDMENTYLHLFVVFKEKLPEAILRDIGGGFVAFDKFAIACDIFFDNEIRGSIIFDKGNIERYNRIFMTLDNYIEPLNKEFVKKYFYEEDPAKSAFVVK